jgi:fumarate hydratase class I
MVFPMQFLQNSLVELITQTSTNLPPDVRAAMSATGLAEKPDTQASQALNIIFSNIDMAADDSGAICQDTGMPTFYVHTPVGVNQIAIRGAIFLAVAKPRTGANFVRTRSIPLPAKTAAIISDPARP